MSRRLAALVSVVALVAVACVAAPYDYTGDRKADPVYVTYPSGDWLRMGESTPLLTGQPGDVAVSGDYDGNGIWEPAVLRGTDWVSSALAAPIHYAPPLPTGPVGLPWLWYQQTPHPTNALPAVIPVPADYDGDHTTDPAYWSQVDGTWWIEGQPSPVSFGIPPTDDGTLLWDVPVPADYDGDGKADIAIYRPSDSTFRIWSTGQIIQIGTPGDIPVPADYDGDGKAEPATYRVITGEWTIAGHPDPIVVAPSNQYDAAYPVPADYDGDKHADPAVIDITTGVWTVYGQGSIGTIPNGFYGVAANLPAYASLNRIRLTYAYQCIHEGYGDRCPANP